MCLPIPQLVGSVEIEERRPKRWNEPRRKRLNFVKSDNKKRSAEWKVAPKSERRPSPQNQQELWDVRQAQVQERFHNREANYQHWLRWQQWQQQLRQQQAMQQHAQHPHPHPHAQVGMGQDTRTRQPQIQHHHDDGNSIVEIFSGSDDGDEGSRPSRGRKQPRMLELKPTSKLPAHLRKHGLGKKRATAPNHFLVPSDSSETDDSFEAVVPRRLHRRSKSRSRTRNAYQYDFSDDDSLKDAVRKLRLHGRKQHF